LKEGEDADFVLILYHGKASIVHQYNKIAEAGSGTIIGENVLDSKTKRKASLIT
jgi:hypothetical protein